jgi:hypothetical protein
MVPVLVVSSSPAEASPGCISEAPSVVLGLTCDDENPPITGTATSSVTGTTGTVTALASYNDADAGAITFQCQVNGGAWGACTIPGLAAGSYSIAIRAVDSADAARTPCEQIVFCTAEVPDYDATPVTVGLTVNPGGGGTGSSGTPNDPVVVSSDPETKITKSPHDRITPATPVSLSRHPKVTLWASEAATFRCAVNQHRVPCHGGVNTLKKLQPGIQVFAAQAVDREGHFDRTPATLTFYLPVNARAGHGWRTVKSHGAYAGDYVATRQRGAVLTLATVHGVRELRVIAPTGKNFGKIAVRIGSGGWMKVDLGSGRGKQLAVFVVRKPSAKPVSGAVQVRALVVPRGGVVAIDAIVAR